MDRTRTPPPPAITPARTAPAPTTLAVAPVSGLRYIHPLPRAAQSSFALIVGVNDYTAFSESGKDNLVGSVNDAIAAARFSLDLGCPASHIHLCLAEPGVSTAEIRARLGPDFADAHISGATRDEILHCMSGLAESLTRPQSKGLLWFSGHGFTDATGPALCPADIRPGEGQPQNLIRNADVLDLLAIRDPDSRLMVVIDACHSSAASRTSMRPRALSASLSMSAADAVDLRYEDYGNVVAVAARTHEQGWELTGAGAHHGAFSWAMLTVLRRWGVVGRDVGGRIDRFVDLTYADLMDKVRRLLETLEVPQRPVLYVPQAMLNRTVFHGFGNDDMESGSPEPRGGRELFPGGGGAVLPYMIASAVSGGATALYVAGPSLKGDAAQNWRAETLYLDGPLPQGDFKTWGGIGDVGTSMAAKSHWPAFEDADLKVYSGGSVIPEWLITTGDFYGTSGGGYTIVGGLSVGTDGSLHWFRTDYDEQTMPTRIASMATTTLYFTHNVNLNKPISPLWSRIDPQV